MTNRFGQPGVAVIGALALCGLAGCLGGPVSAPPPGMVVAPPGQPLPPGAQFPPDALQNNPAFIPVQDQNLIWDQLVDVVDDYFDIEREDRVRLVGDILTEGRIDTFPKGASTMLEPWNRDSVTPYERLEATLQSTRRQGTLRVIPTDGGFLVDVNVLKELEDVQSPDIMVLSDNDQLRNDNSYRRFSNASNGGGHSLGWIPKCRDVALEQEIIAQIQSRFQGPGGPGPLIIGSTKNDVPPATAQWKPSNEPTKTR